jgi:hypothetical protein
MMCETKLSSASPHSFKQAFDMAGSELVLLLRTYSHACKALDHALINLTLSTSG